ncbi:hypothetical protein KKK_12805 [Pseudomonas putida B6-2]|nr:hypothetical protein KKK_12805 [Pseudomonas putida B6-2]
MRLGGISRSFDLVVRRCRDRALGHQPSIASFVVTGLLGPCPSSSYCLLLRARLQIQIHRIQAHQGLSAFDCLSGIDQALQDFSGYSEAEVTLRASYHNPGKRTCKF